MLNKEEEKQNAMNPKHTRNITTGEINVSTFNEKTSKDLSKSLGKPKVSLVDTPKRNKLLDRKMHVDIYKSAHLHAPERLQDKTHGKSSIKVTFLIL